MSDGRFFSLREIKSTARHMRKHWHETWADQAHHTGTALRQRMPLVAEAYASRLHASVEAAKRKGRRVAKEIAVRAALRVSRKLAAIARKIEQKAQALRQNQ